MDLKLIFCRKKTVRRFDAVFSGKLMIKLSPFLVNDNIFDVLLFLNLFDFLIAIHSYWPEISPDGQSIVSSDDMGTVCVWGQSKSIIR